MAINAATQPGRSTRTRATAPPTLPEPSPATLPAAPEAVLSPRQLETLTLIARGATDKQIGRLLRISVVTVHHHLQRARDRLGAAHTAHAVALAIQLRIIEP